MRRAETPAATSAAENSTGLHLVLRTKTPTGELGATVSSTPLPNECNPVDCFAALVLLASMPGYQDEQKARILRQEERLSTHKTKPQQHGKKSRLHFSESSAIFKIPYEVFLVDILSYLLDTDNACLLRLTTAIAPKYVPSVQEKLEGLADALRITAESSSKVPYGAGLFITQNYQGSLEIASLLDATLNADLGAAKEILLNKNDVDIKAMLSATGTAQIAHLSHLGIERRGTPLQMALYSDDEEMFAFYKNLMEAAEFQRQCHEVFGADYKAFVARQQREAEALYCELASTVTEGSVDCFKINLEAYIKDNPVHNCYILQDLHEIYNRLPGDYNQNCLFSQKVIALAESLSSARWLQHYAQGIYSVGGGDAENNQQPESAGRSFRCRGSNPLLDIRSLVPYVGPASGGVGIVAVGGLRNGLLWWRCLYQTYVEQKQLAWKAHYAAGTDSSRLEASVHRELTG